MKKLFGSNVDVRCEYCNHSNNKFGRFSSCDKRKRIKRGKCRSFSYNPLHRVPNALPELPKFDPDAFIL